MDCHGLLMMKPASCCGQAVSCCAVLGKKMHASFMQDTAAARVCSNARHRLAAHFVPTCCMSHALEQHQQAQQRHFL